MPAKKKKKRKPRKKAAKKSRRTRKRKTKVQRKQSSKSKKKRKKKKHNFPKNPEKGTRKTISIGKRGGGKRKVTFEATGKKGFGAWRIVSNK